MSEIQVFNHPQFGEIRTAGTAGEPLFCAMDLCRALGYVNGRDAVSKHVDSDDVAKCDATDSVGRVQSLTFVNESGMYALVLSSKLPAARQFKHWVTSEVLPSIRKHGAYMTTATLEKVMNDPDSWIKLLQALKDEREAKVLAQERAAALEYENKVQAEKIANDAPKVEHHELFMNAEHGNVNVSVRKFIAQSGITSEKKFWRWMEKEKGIIYRDSKGRPMPYAGKNRTIFAMSDKHNDKNNWSGTQLMVTPTGKVELAKMYFKDHPECFYETSKQMLSQLDLFG